MKSPELVTSRRLALMASRAVCLSWQSRRQQDEEAAGQDATKGGADTEPSTDSVEHDCASAQSSAGARRQDGGNETASEAEAP
jgi:hypothetical protein